MTIQDKPNSGVLSTLSPAVVTGDDGALAADGLPVNEAKRLEILERRRFLLTQTQKDQEAALKLSEFLRFLFLTAKKEAETPPEIDPETGEPVLSLSENPAFLDEVSTGLGVNRDEFKRTMADVRSGKLSALDAANRTQAGVTNLSNVNWKAAETAVAKYASSGHPLLELIASRESGGNYNVFHNGTAKGGQANLTGMTVNEVIAWQEQRRKEGAVSTAAGKYQIIYTTLKGLKDKNPEIGNQLFDEKMQDRLCMELVEGCGLSKLKKGQITQAQFMERLSGTWAALPKDMSGSGVHDGVAGNKALVSPAVLAVAIRASVDTGYQSTLAAQFAQGGVAQTSSPPNLTASWKPSGTPPAATVIAQASSAGKPAIFKTTAPV